MATMFPCPNCAGQLRFSVKEQALKCRSCGSLVDIMNYKPDDKINADSLNTKIYTCPNCCGEIQLIDNDGMEFCPFCGTQATMQEHFSTEGAPEYILPFKIDKQQAKEEYERVTKNIRFAPDGLKDDENIEKLVGLYTPYYLYDYTIFNQIDYKGTKKESNSDYETTYIADINVNCKVDNLQVPYDASQALDDTIANKLEPFPTKQLEHFNPNYLAGYFVENSTVDKDLYQDESFTKARDYLTGKVLCSSQGFSPGFGAKPTVEKKVSDGLKFNGPKGAYMPLYFMTTRYGDRVAYSIVNGATGKTYMDMPVEKRKMFGCGVLFSALIFAFLVGMSFLLSFSYKVKDLCSFCALVSSIIAWAGAYYAYKTYRSDNHIDDKGFFRSKANIDDNTRREAKNKPEKGGLGLGVLIAAVVIINYLLLPLSIMPGVMYLFSFIVVMFALSSVKKGDKKVMLLGLLGWGLSLVIRVINLPYDIMYYIALLVVFGVILVAFNAIVDEYNRFATHPSPQFMKTGGGLEHARD